MRELTQKELVTIALYLLGGEKKSFETEDIAVKVAEIAPGKFSWRKYRENIDQELVRRSLTSAKLIDMYVVGLQKDGWMLSKKGLIFARENINKSWIKPSERVVDPDKLKFIREKERLLSTDAYHYYVANGLDDLGNIQKKMADDFFRLNDYVKGQARIKKITYIENTFTDDPEVGPVLKILAEIATAEN